MNLAKRTRGGQGVKLVNKEKKCIYLKRERSQGGNFKIRLFGNLS